MASSVKPKLAATPRNALLTVEDVAALLQVPVSWIYERPRRGGAIASPVYI
jgi:hypothetical protein